jgi:hypothetical protein
MGGRRRGPGDLLRNRWKYRSLPTVLPALVTVQIAITPQIMAGRAAGRPADSDAPPSSMEARRAACG